MRVSGKQKVKLSHAHASPVTRERRMEQPQQEEVPKVKVKEVVAEQVTITEPVDADRTYDLPRTH